MILVPDGINEAIATEYALAEEVAQKNLKNNLSVIEEWKKLPESVGWHMLACDISDGHVFYNTWIDTKVLKKYFELFTQDSFKSLFFRYMKFCGRRVKCGELEVAEVVVTHGDTAPAVLFQAIGKEAIEEIPGFFGNFYIRKVDLASELERYNRLLATQDLNSLIQRGVQFYNAPCSNSEDRKVVEDIINALPKAIEYANEKQCGLLGLVVTAG